MSSSINKLTNKQLFLKRGFDIIISIIALLLTCWIILIVCIIVTIYSRQNGIFTQNRVGRNGRMFKLLKIRTMRNVPNINTNVTTGDDPRITSFGRLLRKTKIDELPQLLNVLLGDMSLVGPRPDVSGFADQLIGEDRIILSLRPGITGPATLYYRNEEEILMKQKDPEHYSREVIWPNKIRMNLNYIRQWSFLGDIRYILQTMRGFNSKELLMNNS